MIRPVRMLLRIKVEHVLPDLVGAEHVVLAGQREQRHGRAAASAPSVSSTAFQAKAGLAAPRFSASRPAVRHSPADAASHPHARSRPNESQHTGTEAVHACIVATTSSVDARRDAAPPCFRRGKSRTGYRPARRWFPWHRDGSRAAPNRFSRCACARAAASGIEQRQHLDGVACTFWPGLPPALTR
jgi:hypothetical protein